MRRVCVLCESWGSGGIEAFLTNVISHMDLGGIEVDVVCAQLGESVFTETLKELGVSFYQLSGSTRRVAENRRRFRQLLGERGYDVVHLNAYQALSLGYLCLAREAGVPVRIAHSHNTALRKSATRPLKLALHRWAGEKYKSEMTCRWACSRAAAEFLFGRTEDWSFIPNGIDAGRFRFDAGERERLRRELGLEDKLTVGNVGRLCYQKNQAFLLEVFREVLARRPESVLLLVGEGADKPRLEERARSLGIWEKVIFYGVSHEVERLFWAMDVFAFPSLFEGLGIAAVEAQAAGLPVLCSEGVPPEAIVTGQVTRLDLSAGARAWAEAALHVKAPGDRGAAAEAVYATGYGVAAVAEKIREAWME